jgi:hypothetical protein
MNCLVCNKKIECDDDGEPRICDDHWKCPNCGAVAHPSDSEDGLIYEPDEGFVNCYVCGKGWTVKEIERKIVKKTNLVPCPHCKGTGFVKGPKVGK